MKYNKEALCFNDHIAELEEAETMRLIDALPQWRRDVALRYKHLQGRRECAVGYIELLRGFRLCFGIDGMPEFGFNEHGKPYLKDYPDIYFSISHCREAVGCLVSDRPCGFDVEHIRKAKEELVRYTMSEEEQNVIFSHPFPDIAFTRLWTQKEAVLKLKGTGIVDDLHNVLSQENLNGITLKTIENTYRGYIFTTAIKTD